MDIEVYTGTRRALHGVAELLLAGPQWRASRSIELRVLPGGFGTVTDPDVRVDGAELVHNGQRLALSGTSYAGLGTAAGLEVGIVLDAVSDGFWNAAFGAARPVRELAGDSLGRFFEEGRARAGERS